SKCVFRIACCEPCWKARKGLLTRSRCMHIFGNQVRAVCQPTQGKEETEMRVRLRCGDGYRIQGAGRERMRGIPDWWPGCLSASIGFSRVRGAVVGGRGGAESGEFQVSGSKLQVGKAVPVPGYAKRANFK